MKIFKDKINILFYFSIMVFVVACFFHTFSQNKIVKAVGTTKSLAGVTGGSIGPCNPPVLNCSYCAPELMEVTITQKYGGDILEMPYLCVPTTGLPLWSGPSLIQPMVVFLMGATNTSSAGVIQSGYGGSYQEGQ